jgi:SAM-dependent methyltransferase
LTNRWTSPDVVRGFSTGAPNEVLMRFVREEAEARGTLRAVDVGCGAARNAAPMAELGVKVVGLDLARPMLAAARDRARGLPVTLAAATMHALPLRSGSVDLVVAHGIWNLARSGTELRAAVAEASRVARPGAALFVFTFSRATLPDAARPLPGEEFVFDQFSGEPQCFLTAEQLVAELAVAGFEPQSPLTEYNRPRKGALVTGGPVIYEGVFRRR